MQGQSNVTDRVRQIAGELRAGLESIEGPVRVAGGDERHYDCVRQILDRCLVQLGQLNFWGPANRVPSSELWNVAGPILERGWLQNRARAKPRGYAGDYEMLARIYEERLCDDPLGRLFDRYFQEQAAPVAVRHRMRMMADWIVDSVQESGVGGRESGTGGKGEMGPPFRIAIFGSAFGLEVRDALLRLDIATRNRLHVTLLDLDPAAVEFAGQQLQSLLRPDQIVATAENLFRLPDRPSIAGLLDGADLLFCPGLFDYLDETAAVAMLRALATRLAPGGRLTIFQFAPHNPTRAYMEWVANWYLIYRDTAQLQSLVAAAGIPAAHAHCGAEPLGVDLYVTIDGDAVRSAG